MNENETDCKIKRRRSGSGGEFTSKEFDDFCRKHGIESQFTIAESPQQNGVVERANIYV